MASIVLFACLLSFVAIVAADQSCTVCCDKPFNDVGTCCVIPPMLDADVAKECNAPASFNNLIKAGSVSSKITAKDTAKSSNAQKTKKDTTTKPKGKPRGKRQADTSAPCVWDCIFKKKDFYNDDGTIDDDMVLEDLAPKLGTQLTKYLNESIEVCADVVETNDEPQDASCKNHKAMFFINCLRHNMISNCPKDWVKSKKEEAKSCETKIKAVEECQTGVVSDPPKSAWQSYEISDEELAKYEAELARKEKERKAAQEQGQQGKSKNSAQINSVKTEANAKTDPKSKQTSSNTAQKGSNAAPKGKNTASKDSKPAKQTNQAANKQSSKLGAKPANQAANKQSSKQGAKPAGNKKAPTKQPAKTKG